MPRILFAGGGVSQRDSLRKRLAGRFELVCADSIEQTEKELAAAHEDFVAIVIDSEMGGSLYRLDVLIREVAASSNKLTMVTSDDEMLNQIFHEMGLNVGCHRDCLEQELCARLGIVESMEKTSSSTALVA